MNDDTTRAVDTIEDTTRAVDTIEDTTGGEPDDSPMVSTQGFIIFAVLVLVVLIIVAVASFINVYDYVMYIIERN